MSRASGLTVSQRLLLVTTLASSSALLIAISTLAILDERQARSDLLARRATDAELIGLHGASAVVFDDAETARSTLAALRVKGDVENACIYDRSRHLFAGWSARGLACAESLAAPGAGARIEGGRLLVERPIVLDGETVGSVAIASNLDELAQRQRRLLGLGVGVALLAFAASLLISWRYQRTLSVPLLELARTATQVSEAKDYSVRVATTGPGEIGLLVSSFNEMLARIQDRDHELLGVQLQLEDRVQERTRDLERELAERRKAEGEVHRLNDALTSRLDEVTALNREIESFSYSVSHDLRAPLRHVNGFVDLLRERAGATLDATGQRYLDVIARGAKQMGCLIDDLLGFSRMSRLELRERDVPLGPLVEEVREEIAQAAAREIDWCIAPLPTVRGDRAMLRIVFVNLLSNAVKYSSKTARSRVEVGWQRTEQGLAAVFVKDNGVGFDMRYADKLFGVFQRLHRAEEFEGTGIGLATVRRIVNRHGGEAWADSVLGQGSTFQVSLVLLEGAA